MVGTRRTTIRQTEMEMDAVEGGVTMPASLTASGVVVATATIQQQQQEDTHEEQSLHTAVGDDMVTDEVSIVKSDSSQLVNYGESVVEENNKKVTTVLDELSSDCIKGENSDDQKLNSKKRRVDEYESDVIVNENMSSANRLENSKSQSTLEISDSQKDTTIDDVVVVHDDASDKQIANVPHTQSTTFRITRNSSLKKHLSIHEESKDAMDSKDLSPSRSSSSPKERISTGCNTSVASSKIDLPRKAILPQNSIPKKQPRNSNTEESTDGSSLLAHLNKPMPPPSVSTQSTTSRNRRSTVPASRSPPRAKPDTTKSLSSATTTQSGPHEPTQPSLTKQTTISSSQDVKEQKLQTFLANQAKLASSSQSLSQSGDKSSLHFNEVVVLKDLQELCNCMGDHPNFQLPPPNQLATSRVDLTGSFLSESFDYFDRNDRGEIVLPRRQPMFPEEFPPGMTEHSFSWWGILDPTMGDGKFRTSIPSAELAQNPPMKSSREHATKSLSAAKPVSVPREFNNTHSPFSQRGHPNVSHPPKAQESEPSSWRGSSTARAGETWDDGLSHGGNEGRGSTTREERQYRDNGGNNSHEGQRIRRNKQSMSRNPSNNTRR